MAKRLLPNWLDGFLEWTIPRSETPTSMLKWAGVFTMASVLRRKVSIPRKMMGGYTIFPNFYIVYVGKPAIVRKSTTVGFVETVLTDALGPDRVPLTFSGDVTSASKLLSALSDSVDSSVIAIPDEFSSLIQTTSEAMYEILTQLFDNKKEINWETWAHGDHNIKEPTFNLLTATTPAWVSKQPPEYFAGGGFASRVIFVYEEKPRQREIFYDHLDQGKLGKLETSLKHDINIIAGIEGEFSFDTKGTKEHIRAWYLDQKPEGEDERVQGYYGRKHVHGLKVAMILSLCQRDDLKIDLKSWEESLEMLEQIELKMSKAFSTLGINPYALMMQSILEYVQVQGSRNLQQIAGRFFREGWTLEQLKSALSFLCTGGKLRSGGSMINPDYTFKEM